METANYFKAPWGNRLKVITLLSSVFMLGLPAYLYFNKLIGSVQGDRMLILLPALLLLSALFVVRGYALTPSMLYVQRMFWQTKIDLSGLQSILVDPDATSGSIRTLGNGGLFSFSGKFRNKNLGNYRAFLTDQQKAVVLTFPDRKIVISPENPQDFERQLKQFIGLK